MLQTVAMAPVLEQDLPKLDHTPFRLHIDAIPAPSASAAASAFLLSSVGKILGRPACNDNSSGSHLSGSHPSGSHLASAEPGNPRPDKPGNPRRAQAELPSASAINRSAWLPAAVRAQNCLLRTQKSELRAKNSEIRAQSLEVRAQKSKIG